MSHFLRTSAQLFSLSVAGKALAIATTILFARWMGPENLGSFSTFMAIAGMMATIALLGLPSLQMREVAQSGNGAMVQAITPITISGLGLLTVSLFVSIVFAQLLSITHWIPGLGSLRDNVHLFLPLVLLGLTLPRYAGQTLVGLGFARTVTTVNQIGRPAMILGLAAIWGLMDGQSGLSPEKRIVVEVSVALLSIGVLYSLLFWKAKLTFVLDSSKLTRPEFLATWIAAFNFAGIAMSQVLFTTTDVLALGFFVSAEQVGIYKVAAVAAALLLFPMNSMSSVYAPRIARGFLKGEIQAINGDMRRLSTMVLLLGLPFLLVFLFVPLWPLKVLFGETYLNAAMILSVLAAGSGVQLLLGPVGWALTMTGNEHTAMRILVVGAAINLALNLLLVPRFGGQGAAIATMVATIITYSAMAFVLRKRTGIVTWVLLNRFS